MTKSITIFRAYTTLLQFDQGKVEFEALRSCFDESAWNRLVNDAVFYGLNPQQVVIGFICIEAAHFLIRNGETALERAEIEGALASRCLEFANLHRLREIAKLNKAA